MAMTVVDKDCTEKAECFVNTVAEANYERGYKDGYVKAIEEFAEQIKARAHSTERNDWSADYMISIWESVIDEIAMELKGE